ncbi:hydroxyacylglutathione hydrolase [Vibrio sp. S11_S32]|uniref:hydroxyacylglutathione hydrolase n=1 Tax=Vibrio sp. S11_S32 TaxID=2720225 RepID=UPI0016808B9F|nr:hydroxyacylglutathione hydrolase [Vibrio sp. S11_S32]MBD1575062.1 hydroxyacylglutathione hydrolase [Vibrio sp. S11_S32]
MLTETNIARLSITGLTIETITAFNDNYIWSIQNHDQRCVLVDPGEAAPALSHLQQHNLDLDTIILTHHHADHVGGVAELLRHYPKTKVIGPANDPVMMLTQSVHGGDRIDIFGETFLVIDVPGHTAGHIAYVGDGKLFCGDVLFSAGCGRVFEGTYQQMYDSLQKLASLPQETQVYCAHEYTSANLSFALAVEPENDLLHQYRDEVNRLRAQDKPTIPTTLRQEKWINPFLRCQEPNVMKAVSARTDDLSALSVFTALRDWKNDF